MRLTTKTSLLFTFFQSGICLSQGTYSDFSTWYWIQTKYNINKKNSMNFQFQSRFNQNSSLFDKSNFYFSFERKLTKRFNAEALYQFTTSYNGDQHTFYAGSTYKLKLKPFILFFRSAIQHKQNNIFRNPFINNSFNEWRNRIRLSYPLKNWTFAISTEPYLAFSAFREPCFSRIRNVLQATYNFNSFHSLSSFYLIEPTLNNLYSKRNDFVLGFTYQITIPKKKKQWKHFFDFNEKDEEQKIDKKDTFN